MRDYLASFQGEPRSRIVRRLGIVLLSALGASAVLLGISAATLILLAILIGFALVIPELLATAIGIVLIIVQPKTDFSIGILVPLASFFLYWSWFAAHFFHF